MKISISRVFFLHKIHGSVLIHHAANNMVRRESMQKESSASPSQEPECLPEENVSIIEDMTTDEKIENMKAMVSGTMRRKLYFNPAYFEPHLLAVSISYQI